MGSFKPTLVPASVRAGQLSDDALYWNRLDFPITIKEYGCISSIAFCPVRPFNYLVSCGSKVQVYDGDTRQLVRSVGRFKGPAYGGSYRADGKLMAVGAEDHQARLFTTDTGAQLRLFKGHKGPVNCCEFLADGYRLATFSGDARVRCWDIATERSLLSLKGHQDTITCGCTGTTNGDLIVSGSSDGTVRLWDVREGKECCRLEHGHPVRDLLLFPNDGLLVSAGGTVVKVWDLVAGGRPVVQLSQHHKHVTCLALCSANRRLMSASLDRHVKIYELAGYEAVHTLDYPAPILAMAISPDDGLLAVGMTDGLLSVQARKPPAHSAAPRPVRKRGMSLRYTIKNHPTGPVEKVEKEEQQLPRYDQFLRTFQYSRALDTVLAGTYFTVRRPEVTVALLRELIRRGALKRAMAGRDYQSLAKLVTFLARNIGRSAFARTMLDAAEALLDVYEEGIGEADEKTVLLFGRLRSLVSFRAGLLTTMARAMGSLEMFSSMAASSSPPSIADQHHSPDTQHDLTLHEVRQIDRML